MRIISELYVADQNFRSKYTYIFIPEYYSGQVGGVCNIESDVIRSKQECMNILEKLSNKPSGNFWTGHQGDIPSGCSIRNGGDMKPHLEYSTTGVGNGRSDLIPICKRQDDLHSSGIPKYMFAHIPIFDLIQKYFCHLFIVSDSHFYFCRLQFIEK